MEAREEPTISPGAESVLTPGAPMKPRRRRWWVVLRVALLLVVLGVVWFWLGQPAFRRHQLVTACASADRIVLAFQTPPARTADSDWSKGERVTCGIAGSDKVHDFLALIEPRASIPYLHCRCSTVPVIELAQGDLVLASLTLHHDSALRWRSGKWNGDARLTPASVVAMQGWIEREGGRELHQLEESLHVAWEQYQAAREAQSEAAEAARTKPAESSTQAHDEALRPLRALR